MNAFVPYLAALHQQDLLQQAEIQRRVKLATAAQPRVPTWRRSLSGLLASFAGSLDPSVEVTRSTRLPTGRGANAVPAC